MEVIKKEEPKKTTKEGELGDRRPLRFPDKKDAYLQRLVTMGLL